VNRFLIGEADLSRRKRAAAVDRAAAAWMLQSALDASHDVLATSWSAEADHPRLPTRNIPKRRGSSAFAEDDEE
jgi:hypothetical protein